MKSVEAIYWQAFQEENANIFVLFFLLSNENENWLTTEQKKVNGSFIVYGHNCYDISVVPFM